MTDLIAINGANLGYGHRTVLSKVDFTVRSGEFLGIVGPNGSGKTTLLKTILGLIRPLSGTVTVDRQGLRIGYVPQRESVDTLFPLTVTDIVLMGRYPFLGPFQRPGKAEKEAALHAMDRVGILNLADRSYPNLSGGQKQRALIARALVGEPTLLILDEPTNGMDLASETSIMRLVARLHADNGITVLMVSHLLGLVANHAERIALVGDATIQEGDVATLIEDSNLSKMYSMVVKVREVEGQRVILPPFEVRGIQLPGAQS